MTQLIVARGESPGGAGDPDDDLNHIVNGKFESVLAALDGWHVTNGVVGVDLIRETADPITGTGSIRYQIGSDSGGTGLWQNVRCDASYVGQTWKLSFDHRGENVAMMVYLDLTGASDIESPEYFTAAAIAGSYDWEFVVPSGTTNIQVMIVTDWNGAPQDNKKYWLDNVKLVKTADA